MFTNKDINPATSSTPSNISYQYSYASKPSMSRGEILHEMKRISGELQNQISDEDMLILNEAITSYSEMIAVIVNLQMKLENISSDFKKVIDSSLAVVNAIDNKGSHPEYHDKILARHSEEWPFLWERISLMRSSVENEINKNL